VLRVAVKRANPVSGVSEPDTTAPGRTAGIESDTVIANRQDEPTPFPARIDGNFAGSGARFQTVAHGILDERLQHQCRDKRGEGFGGDRLGEFDTFPEPGAFDARVET
jgi:hypothetical protein